MKKKNIIFSILSIGFIIASIMAFIYDYNCYGIILFILGLLMLAVALLINIFNVNVKKCIKINMSAFIAMSQKNKNKLNYKNMPTTFIVEEQTDSIDNQQEDSHSIEDNNFITTESESNTTNVEKEEQPITDIDLSKGEEIIHELHILINKKETNNIEVTLISNPESKLQYKIGTGEFIEYSKPFTINHTCVITGKGFFDDGISIEKVENINSFISTRPIINENNRVVSILPNDKEVDVYYTIDGTLPTRNSLKYEKPFTIKRSCKISAFTCKAGYKDSDIVSTYIEIIITPEERIRQFTNEQYAIGISYQGEGHIRNFTPCQDFHSYKRINEYWSIAIVSDGAGSAKYSADGSKAVCLAFTHYLEDYLLKSYPDGSLPENKEWDIEFRGMLHKFQIELSKQAEAQSIEFKSLAATIIIVAYSKQGYLVAHIGDGRAAVKTSEGWQAVITPHKGEEANQTIFSTSILFSNYPNLKMSGVYVPETYVGRTSIKAFSLMSDGCECGLWHMNHKVDLPNGDFRIEEKNVPYSKGLDDALSIIDETSNLREKRLLKFITSYNNPLAKEIDDKTILIGIVR